MMRSNFRLHGMFCGVALSTYILYKLDMDRIHNVENGFTVVYPTNNERVCHGFGSKSEVVAVMQ